jgi:hypothetical protein
VQSETTTKRCSTCGEVKPTTEYYKQTRGLAYQCKACARMSQRRFYERNRDRLRADLARRRKDNPTLFATHRRASRLKMKYGITPKEHATMLAAQGEACAICCVAINGKNNAGWSQANVDHCHNTGRVRALLCHRCNVAIGYIEKSRVPIEHYLNYIQKHKQGDVVGKEPIQDTLC